MNQTTRNSVRPTSGAARTVAARGSTRHRHWRRVDPRAAADEGGRNRWIGNLFFFSVSLRRRWRSPSPATRRNNAQQQLILIFSFWSRSASLPSPSSTTWRVNLLWVSSSPLLWVAGGGTKRLLVFGFPSGLQAGGVAVSPLQWKAGRRELSLLPTGWMRWRDRGLSWLVFRVGDKPEKGRGFDFLGRCGQGSWRLEELCGGRWGKTREGSSCDFVAVVARGAGGWRKGRLGFFGGEGSGRFWGSLEGVRWGALAGPWRKPEEEGTTPLCFWFFFAKVGDGHFWFLPREGGSRRERNQFRFRVFFLLFPPNSLRFSPPV